MLTPEQLQSVQEVIDRCKRDHQREVCSFINRISDYEPRSRIAPSQFLEGYLIQVSQSLQEYEQNLKDETIRVTRVVCPVLTESEKERILSVADSGLAEEFYLKRFKIVCDAIVRHFSRYGMKINLSDYRVDLIEARHTAGIKNKMREIRQLIRTELSLLVSRPQAEPLTKNEGFWNEALHLKPSFFGIGINLNYIISKLYRKKQ